MLQSLLIIARSGFQDHELAGVKSELLKAGFRVILGSTEAGQCTGKFGSTEEATVTLKDCRIADYDRIGFIGGPGAEALFDDEDARALARATVEAGKPLGAICIAPLILAKAGVLKGRKATVWDSGGEQIAILKAHGAVYTDQAVVIDGSVVTGNGPGAAGEFGRVFAGAVGSSII